MLVGEPSTTTVEIEPGYACSTEEEQPGGTAAFLIATPLQALNAIEARQHFKLLPDQCPLVWFHSASEANDRQTEDILGQADWARIHTISHSGGSFRSWKRRFDDVNAAARSMGRPEYLFVGDYAFDLMRHFAHAVKSSKVVVLDDGNSTLLIDRSRRDPAVPYHFMPNSLGGHVKHLVKTRLCGMNRSLLDRITFFTVYALEPDQGIEVVPNSYRHLRHRLHVLSVNDETHFLGAALSDKNLMSEDVYLSYLERALKQLDRASVIYMSHRLETAPKLARIRSELGIEVRESTMPVECRLCQATSVPKLIAGFITSAFDTCRVLVGDRIGMRSFYLDPNDCARSIHSEIEEFYRHYDSYTTGNFELVRAF